MTRRRVPRFQDRANRILDAAEWPEGVKVRVDHGMVFMWKGDGGRAMWTADPYDLASAAPDVVRATAIRRLESTGRDPRYTEKSRAEDLALANALRGPHDVIPCDHPAWEHLACCLTCGRDALWVRGDGKTTPEVYRHVEES